MVCTVHIWNLEAEDKFWESLLGECLWKWLGVLWLVVWFSKANLENPIVDTNLFLKSDFLKRQILFTTCTKYVGMNEKPLNG